MSHSGTRVGRCGPLIAGALALAPLVASGDRPARPDPIGPIVAAAARADLGEIARVAARLPPTALAQCIAGQGASRGPRLACLEAARFAPVSPETLVALAEALASRDRSIATAAGAALVPALEESRRQRALDLDAVATTLATVARDPRLGVDLRGAALRALALVPRARIDLAPLLSDPETTIRREAVAVLIERDPGGRLVEGVAEREADASIAALAAAALCESGRVRAAVDARVRRWLADAALGPATLGPLLSCARAREGAPTQAWIDAARSSPRPDVRALAGGQ